MRKFPEENDFLSLFESEPMLLDSTSKDLPFYYNEATYRFSNEEEDFIVKLSPSYGEVKVKVTQRSSNRLLSLLDLKRVEKLEITADKKERASMLLTVVNEDSQQTIEIDFKPHFKQIFKEHLTR
ncbi:hypothetical protein J7I93_09330 [Bacillus sp. ISL-47]|uniref:hypothetical protein n=1 Tax=Bacillus sp. ISL-47 TaxID=2819130 RepID=UPI001BE98C01|nr:hypothetical protein [Bacillus sp. ISL-47]MBT2688383.1 hypothetical protein [Bacillus sp. ISL-47]MBT2710506.1 hypothetical protein [Pseudomonas sp. ISL-84]